MSHVRHHQYTLHPPDDLEDVLPIRMMLKEFFLKGFIHPRGVWGTLLATFKRARGDFDGVWLNELFPVSNPARRQPSIRWARILLIGHGLIVVAGVAGALLGHPQLLMVPLLTTLAPFYGSWLFLLCNNTQHMGLKDNVNDFRLCCRTITLNPVIQFLYWHMNYHIEHQMYAAVPCYNLGRLHRLIQYELPPTKHGLIETWKEIVEIQRRQDADSSYQYVQPCPAPNMTRAG